MQAREKKHTNSDMSEFQAEDEATWPHEAVATARPGRQQGDEAARAAELAALRQRIKHAEQMAHRAKQGWGDDAGQAERMLEEESKLEQEEREALQRARAEVGPCACLPSNVTNRSQP